MYNKNRKKLILLASLSSLVFMSGCTRTEELPPEEEYDILLINAEDSDLFSEGLVQKLDVKGETFKLVTKYTCDNSDKRAWRITSDKFLYLDVYTEGLPSDTFVYIDNVHIDTSIKSQYASMDGILQDTMDDSIHNSLMLGFPINDENHYYGVNAIEGNNETFISGSFYGMNGYSHGDIEEERYTESDYMEYGVYANKFQIVYDLLIQGPNDHTPRNVSVNTDFIVPVTTTEVDYGTIDNKTNKVIEKTKK